PSARGRFGRHRTARGRRPGVDARLPRRLGRVPRSPPPARAVADLSVRAATALGRGVQCAHAGTYGAGRSWLSGDRARRDALADDPLLVEGRTPADGVRQRIAVAALHVEAERS